MLIYSIYRIDDDQIDLTLLNFTSFFGIAGDFLHNRPVDHALVLIQMIHVKFNNFLFDL